MQDALVKSSAPIQRRVLPCIESRKIRVVPFVDRSLIFIHIHSIDREYCERRESWKFEWALKIEMSDETGLGMNAERRMGEGVPCQLSTGDLLWKESRGSGTRRRRIETVQTLPHSTLTSQVWGRDLQ